MENNQEKLLAEISNDEIKYVVLTIDQNLNYRITEKWISKNSGIKEGSIINLESATKIVYQDLKKIEKKLNKIFRNITVIINQKEIFCTNVTCYKKLNGAKVEKRDLDYILNEGKLLIIKSYEKNSILHILNSKFFTDKISQHKIPLNIFADHLSLGMTFLLLPKNSIKNVKSLFDQNDLIVERILSRPLMTGFNLINENKNFKNFLVINFDNDLSTITIYENSSLVFLKTFRFGINSIYKDLSQLCSLKKEEIEVILKSLDFNQIKSKNNKYLDKKFFTKSEFTKLSITHIQEIINSRIEEMINYIFNKNTNISFFKNKFSHIYLLFEDKIVEDNLAKVFKKFFQVDQNKIILNSKTLNDSSIVGAAELITKGWDSEAIPYSEEKKSILAGIFSRFFNN